MDHFLCNPAHGLRYLAPVFLKYPSAQNTLNEVQLEPQMAFHFGSPYESFSVIQGIWAQFPQIALRPQLPENRYNLTLR